MSRRTPSGRRKEWVEEHRRRDGEVLANSPQMDKATTSVMQIKEAFEVLLSCPLSWPDLNYVVLNQIKSSQVKLKEIKLKCSKSNEIKWSIVWSSDISEISLNHMNKWKGINSRPIPRTSFPQWCLKHMLELPDRVPITGAVWITLSENVAWFEWIKRMYVSLDVTVQWYSLSSILLDSW
jgi:hypothetical protein